ncbi:isochorismatase family protein [Leptolyngbya ohadii]|uniref:isochorismatase family protein n=1 Tax=Leptolyngbya ohadii TaxID=1962290 RepID=UPI000B599457|nr:isochorismatase family protein [Leptolyngbya ohadii]
MVQPWDDIIPNADRMSFRSGSRGVECTLEAGIKPALLVVDMTRAFVDSRYPTGWSETGDPAVEANYRLLNAARNAAIPIYFTKGYAEPDYKPKPAQRGRWKTGKRPPVDPALPPGDVIVEKLTPFPEEIVIDKQSKPSGFFGTALASYLIYEGVDTVIVTGMTTSGCVRATVLDAFQYNFNVIIPHECCADRSQISHKVSLFDLHMKYADVVSVDMAIDYLMKIKDKLQKDKLQKE